MVQDRLSSNIAVYPLPEPEFINLIGHLWGRQAALTLPTLDTEYQVLDARRMFRLIGLPDFSAPLQLPNCLLIPGKCLATASMQSSNYWVERFDTTALYHCKGGLMVTLMLVRQNSQNLFQHLIILETANHAWSGPIIVTRPQYRLWVSGVST